MVQENNARSWLWPIVIVMVVALVPIVLYAQAARSTNDGGASRISFDVVQSFDAKYQGDTPGHLGRAGGLANIRPNVALDDPIYRGTDQIGRVTGLIWNRTNGSLDIEFDPHTKARIAVGDEVWMALNGNALSKDSKRD